MISSPQILLKAKTCDRAPTRTIKAKTCDRAPTGTIKAKTSDRAPTGTIKAQAQSHLESPLIFETYPKCFCSRPVPRTPVRI